VKKGAAAITVLTYFLNSGVHAIENIPAIVNACRGRHPESEIRIAPRIGAAPLMLNIVLASADRVKKT
jgi:sirohydrochlorin ferrochelatase